jgi:hypothetical protein
MKRRRLSLADVNFEVKAGTLARPRCSPERVDEPRQIDGDDLIVVLGKTCS